MEDYKQKYEEAMLRMNKWVEGSEIIDPKEVAEFVFPELKESEDMGKRLIKSIEGSAQFTYCLQKHGFIKEDVISWLEKQGEKHIDRELSNLLNHVMCRFINDPNIPYPERERFRRRLFLMLNNLKKQGEQKPTWSEDDETGWSC